MRTAGLLAYLFRAVPMIVLSLSLYSYAVAQCHNAAYSS